MGPRSYARNGVTAGAPPDGVIVLQWGRAVTRGTGDGGVSQVTVREELQWGRAVTRGTGATEGIEFKTPDLLQWGRAVTRGTGTRRRAAADAEGLGPSFNGAAQLRAERVLGRRDMNLRIDRFNGAAQLRAERVAVTDLPDPESPSFNGAAQLRAERVDPGCCPNAVPVASMGPRSYARNGAATGIQVSRQNMLQWGRAVTRGTGAEQDGVFKGGFGFNGAAQLRAERAGRRGSASSWRGRFNGAAQLRAERGAPSAASSSSSAGFNGAAQLRAERVGGSLGAFVVLGSFNGAAQLRAERG